MKTFLLSFLALISVFSAYAQFDVNRPQTASYDQHWDFGFGYGFSQFKGDVSSKGYFAKLSGESKPSFSINIGKQLSPVFAIKAEFGKSNLYSKSSIQYLGDSTVLSMTGDVNEIGIYGTFNINNLINKNRSADSKWYAYISSGIGYAFWKTRLRDEITKLIVDSVGYTSSGKTSRMKEMVFPITLGVNFQLSDGIWLSLENSSRFINSDRVDAYINGKTDWFSTTKIGFTFNLSKLGSIGSRRNRSGSTPKVRSMYVEPTYDPATPTVKPTRRTAFKSAQRVPPELLDYTGFNPLIPPPVARITPGANQNVSANGTGNKDENRWADPNNPGQFEITGYNKKFKADTLEVKKIDPGVFKGRTIKITRGWGPKGSSRARGAGGSVVTSRSVNSIAQETAIVASFAPGTIYKVQIQASKENISVETVAKKMNITDKVTVEMSDGWYRYYVGSFTAYSAARQNLESYRSKGIKDAFLCAFPNGVRKVMKN